MEKKSSLRSLITLPIRKFKKSSIKQIPNGGKIRSKGVLNRDNNSGEIKINEIYNEINVGIKKLKKICVIKIKLSRIKCRRITSRDFIFDNLFSVLRKQRAANKGEKYNSFSSKNFFIFGLLMVSTIEENLNYSLVLGFNVIVITELG